MSKPRFDATTTVSSEFGIFGIPLDFADCELILLPVPWEVTTSYGAGTSRGPEIIRHASEQIDLFDLDYGKAYKRGIHMLPIDQKILKINDQAKIWAQEAIELITAQSKDLAHIQKLQAQVNAASDEVNQWVSSEAAKIVGAGKRIGLVGGDHSSPFGLIRYLSETQSEEFGVLHIDAHADLRSSYQGFLHSHASIMRNVMSLPKPPSKLVQIGIRDFCEEEYEFSRANPHITTHYDADLKRALFEGRSWKSLVEGFLNDLPNKVYVSFDIDGLDPQFCPHTGTPVPGGLGTDQVFYLLRQIVKSGRQIIAFDLNEVSTGGLSIEESEWDGNVGARVLYKLACATLASHPLPK